MDNTSTNDIELTIKGNVDKRCEAGNERGEAGLYFIWPNIKKYLLLMVWSKEERNVVNCANLDTKFVYGALRKKGVSSRTK